MTTYEFKPVGETMYIHIHDGERHYVARAAEPITYLSTEQYGAYVAGLERGHR